MKIVNKVWRRRQKLIKMISLGVLGILMSIFLLLYMIFQIGALSGTIINSLWWTPYVLIFMSAINVIIGLFIKFKSGIKNKQEKNLNKIVDINDTTLNKGALKGKRSNFKYKDYVFEVKQNEINITFDDKVGKKFYEETLDANNHFMEYIRKNQG